MTGEQLAALLQGEGIDRLESGNCWVFASARYEQLSRAGMDPAIIDWSGHVEAATWVDGGWLTHTIRGEVPFEDHWMSRLKPDVWRVHANPNALLTFLDTEYPLVSGRGKAQLWQNFEKAEQIVGADWRIPVYTS